MTYYVCIFFFINKATEFRVIFYLQNKEINIIQYIPEIITKKQDKIDDNNSKNRKN